MKGTIKPGVQSPFVMNTASSGHPSTTLKPREDYKSSLDPSMPKPGKIEPLPYPA